MSSRDGRDERRPSIQFLFIPFRSAERAPLEAPSGGKTTCNTNIPISNTNASDDSFRNPIYSHTTRRVPHRGGSDTCSLAARANFFCISVNASTADALERFEPLACASGPNKTRSVAM